MRRVIKFFKSKSHLAKKALIFGGTALVTHKLTQKLDQKVGISCFAEEEPLSQDKIVIANENIREINNVTLNDVEYYQEGKIYTQRIMLQDGAYKVMIIKHEGNFYALGAISPYDGCTDLSKGQVFGNKLLSPKNGNAYNITNGEVEYGPGLDNIPIFHIMIQEGKVVLQIPKKPPVKIRPYVSVRDYADMRKVVIIGGTEAAVTAAETLRSLEYTGEITVITPEYDVPINTSKLFESIKHMDYSKLRMRQEEYLQRIGINFFFGQEVVGFIGKGKGAMILTDQDVMFEFEACLLANETVPTFRYLKGMEKADNLSVFKSVEDHKKIRKYLESGESVIGINERSYHFISTLKREYPLVNITVVDENRTDYLTKNYGEEVASTFKNMHKNRGVNFATKRRFIRFDTNGDQIKKINLKGKKIDTDYVVLFPNNFKAKTEMFDDNPTMINDMKRDRYDRIRTFYNNSTGSWRVFAAGGPSAMINFLTNERIQKDLFHKSVNEGMNAAYNIIGLDIPYQVMPFDQFDLYNHTIQEVGCCNFFTECYILGDIEKMDFTAFYAKGDLIYKVVGTNQRGDMQVYNEAFRLGMMPNLQQVKNLGVQISDKVSQKVKESKRSGCFRELIYKVRHDPIGQLVLWREKGHTMGDEVNNPYGERITMKEIDESLDRDRANFMNQR